MPGTSPIPDDFVTVRTVDKAHGRLDVRKLTVSSLLADYQPWPYLAQAFQVIRINQRGRRRKREVRYGITSVAGNSRECGASAPVGTWPLAD